MSRILIPLLLSLTLIGQSQTRNVLFIGNSYTFSNNMPQILANLASSGGSTLNYQVSALPGYTLQQHAANNTTLGMIQRGGWDYVVLQEYSQYPSEPLSTVELYVFPYANFLHNQINSHNANARTLFYMTWGRKNGDAERCARLPEVCTYTGMDDLTRERYMIMAQHNQAEVSPVGAVWRYIRQHFPSIELYDTDGSHPSEAGSYAAACAFYTAIFRKDPALLSYNHSLTPAVADNIRSAAKAVVYNSLSTWYIGSYDVSDHQAPVAPTGLTASNVQQTSLVLSWTASTDNVGIAGYYVYQNGVQIGNVSTTSITISGLTQFTTYTFTVRARDVAGNISTVSQALQVTTIDAEAPTVPTGLSVSNLTQSGFRLTWNASTDNVGVTGYYVYQNGSLVATVQTHNAQISGLRASTSYVITVRARDAAGNISGLSSSITVITPDTEAPTIPAGLTFHDLSQTGFTLTWNASLDNVVVTSYDVYRDGVFVTSVVGTAAGITNLSAFRTYAMTVRAKDAAGNVSAASAILNVTTPDTECPTAPTHLTYTDLTQSGFRLNWTAATDNVGVTGYEIFHDGILLRSVTGTTALLTGLKASTTYRIIVRSRDGAGNLSDPSALITVITPDTEAPTPPSDLTCTNLVQSGFTLNWKASTDNVAVVGYEVYQNGVMVQVVTHNEVIIGGLQACHTYSMTVRAKDAAGNFSNLSTVLNITTPDTEAPQVPGALTTEDITETDFTLKWAASTDNVGVTGYEVYRDGILVTLCTGTAAEVNNLQAYKIYAITVVAKDAAGNASPTSNPLYVRTMDTHPPSVPEKLQAGNITDTTLTLRWNPSLDNVGVAAYDVFMNHTRAFTGSDTVCNFEDLRASTTYLLQVVARDSAGNASSVSVGLTLTTPDTRSPSVPQGLTADGVDRKSFTLRWEPAIDNVAVVTYYIYQDDAFVAETYDTMAWISGLNTHTPYRMTIKAADAAGNVSGFSDSLVVTTNYPGDDNKVTVFPNPVTSNVLYIDLGREGNPETVVEIIDLGGNLIYRLTVPDPRRLIEISGMDLLTGTYFVRIFSGGNVHSNKVLINTY